MGFESINQPGRSSEVECNPKMSISVFWLERGGRWGLSPSTSPADHQKLNVIQKWAFYFFGWRGVADGVWVHRPARPSSSEVEHNPKTSILFFWLERGGRWGLSPSTSPANHQKLNVIQKWAFYFFGWRGVADGVQKLSPLTSPADHQKLNIIQKQAFYFFAAEGWQMGFESIDQPGRSSELECNPKTSILFFWLERGGRRGLSPLTSPADHQKLNVIQKWAFYFFDWRGVADGVWVHWPARPIIRSWT